MGFEKNYGLDLANSISEWKTYLATISLSDREIAYAQNTFVQKGIFEKVCPHEVSWLEDRGLEFLAQEDYDGAYTYFEAAYEKSAEYPLLLHNMIHTHFLRNHYDEAIALSERLLMSNVRKYSNDFALLYIIKSLIAKGKHDEARKQLEGTLLSPLDPLYAEFLSLQQLFSKK
jgi:tetratricopeptide (TPR) repeat protein